MTLQNFDTMLGFAVLMLLLSLVITVLVQFTVALLNIRSRNLRRAIIQLLEQGDACLVPVAKDICRYLFRHPALVPKDSFMKRVPFIENWLTAIQERELRIVLSDFATAPISEIVEKRDPKKIAEIEQAQKKLKEQVVLARIDDRFDSVLRRSSDWFTAKTSVVTAIFAIAVAFGGGTDTIQLFKQLHENDRIRDRLVQDTDNVLTQAKQLQGALAQVPSTNSSQQLEDMKGQLKAISEKLSGTELVIAPRISGKPDVPRYSLGMLITALFLSLGAPFWFNSLKRLASLRPVVAGLAGKKSEQAAEASATDRLVIEGSVVDRALADIEKSSQTSPKP